MKCSWNVAVGTESNQIDARNVALARNCHSTESGRANSLISLSEMRGLRNGAQERFKNSDGV
jgi:hypothetical protein